MVSTRPFGNVHLTFGGTGLLASSCRNFVYDAAGNITSIVTVIDAGSATDDRNPVAAPINNLNQIKRRVVGGATWNYTYDLDGNMTGKTDGTNTYTYTWSDENRLTRVQGPGGLDVTYTYDSIGRMLTRSSAGLLTQFVWDGWDCVRECLGHHGHCLPHSEWVAAELLAKRCGLPGPHGCTFQPQDDH
jgi:YD repeat-containing protein